MDNNKGVIKTSGEVIETLPGASFRVKIEDGSIILAHLSGKLRMYRIRILIGDRVTIEMTPYDKSKGRITYRLKK